MTPNQKGKKNQKHSKPNKVQLFNYYHQFISGLMEKNPFRNCTKGLAETYVCASFLSGCEQSYVHAEALAKSDSKIRNLRCTKLNSCSVPSQLSPSWAATISPFSCHGAYFSHKRTVYNKKEREKNILEIFWSPEGFISSQFLSKEIDLTNIHIFHLTYHDPLKITSWDVHLLQVSGMTDIKSDNTLLAPPKHS